MNMKRFLICTVAVFVVLYILDFIIHGTCLKSLYEQTASLWRTKEEMQTYFWCFPVAYLLFSPTFVYIFNVGYVDGKCPIGQGVKYGLVLGFLFTLMPNLIMYAVSPIPAKLALYWFLGGMFEFVILGIVVGALYKIVK